jgi:2-keto-4-pentenoate hydratase/2-oxohepta-3-ene-1,7-dioic acid hydratase in catechol pathway
MKLYTFIRQGEERLGAEHCGQMVDLFVASGGDPRFTSMLALIKAGDAGLEAARQILAAPPQSAIDKIDCLQLAAPIPQPGRLRGFSVFEQHLRQSAEGAARRLAADAPDPEAAYQQVRVQMNLDNIPSAGWRQTPAYYLMDAGCVAQPDSEVVWPGYSNWIDYELEIVAVIGKSGRDIDRIDANAHIFGYTIINDLSARDAQLQAMATGLGGGKGKDFDLSNPMGPCIVTADEIADPYTLEARVRINGELWSSSSGQDAQFRFDQCIAYASQAQMIESGDLFTTGTLPNSSSIELMRTVNRGDTIDFEVDGIGTLRTRIAP